MNLSIWGVEIFSADQYLLDCDLAVLTNEC